jgi:hypothetical protein
MTERVRISPALAAAYQGAGTLTVDEAREAMGLGKIKRQKYGNVRCELDGFWFDSKHERDYYAGNLKLRVMAGEISELKVHPKFPIEIKGVKVCDVEMDFSYRDISEARYHLIDVKGRDNPLSRLKRKLLEAYTGLKVEIIR